jgi:metallophosphoesterase (TIGR00282 family)
MKILFLGDVMGRSGRAAVEKNLRKLREDWSLDLVIVNAENTTGGKGLSAKHAKMLLSAGADCLTLGDHAFDQTDMIQYVEKEPRIVRPLNFSKNAPGKGYRVIDISRGRKVLVTQVLGQVFMKKKYDDPFGNIDTVLKSYPLGGMVNASVVDIHCEATSEKMAMGHWCDGRVSLCVGTHTHVPTADAMILPKGTGYLTDAGMCGDYNSVIGMEKGEPISRFINGSVTGHFTPALNEATLSGTYVEIDDRTGLAKRIECIRVGGCLKQATP